MNFRLVVHRTRLAAARSRGLHGASAPVVQWHRRCNAPLVGGDHAKPGTSMSKEVNTNATRFDASAARPPSSSAQPAFRIGDIELADVRGVTVAGLSLDFGSAGATCTIERIAVDYVAAKRGPTAFAVKNVTLRNVTARFDDCTLDPACLRSCYVAEVDVGTLSAVIRDGSTEGA